MNDEHQVRKQKWYDNNAIVIVLLIFFFPVGLFALWKRGNFSMGAKWSITAVLALLIILASIPDDPEPITPEHTAEKAIDSVFLLSRTGESITVEYRNDGLYIGYQLDDLPSCHSFECTRIKVRTDGGNWIYYAAHNGDNLGFVRNKQDSLQKNGEVAERLLDAMINASQVEFFNHGTDKISVFEISEKDRTSLQTIQKVCP